MDTPQAILLGAIQGLTEFLPVSSSGHLVLAQNLLGTTSGEDIAASVLMHLGSLLAICCFFFRDILGLFLPRIHWRRLALLIVASIPAAIVGVLLKQHAESALSSPWVACIGLLITSLLLGSTALRRKPPTNPPSLAQPNQSSYKTAAIVGCAQALAILPGVSRSGATIATGLLTGWDRSDALRLSFLMGMIAIGGAGLLEARDISELNPGPAIAAFVSSLVFSLIGLFAIRLVVAKAKLHWFAIYTFIVGVTGLIWLSVA